MVRVITSIYVGGHNLSLTIEEVNQTLSAIIADVATYFKIKKSLYYSENLCLNPTDRAYYKGISFASTRVDLEEFKDTFT